MQKILFLTTAHNYNDDRIFYHQAKELKAQGFEVMICSLYSEFQGIVEGIHIESFDILSHSTKEKLHQFRVVCEKFLPDCIICSEPLAVISVKEYSRRRKIPVLYDITEWYPSTRMLKDFSGIAKGIHFIKFFIIQLYAGFISSAFIFGEPTKKFPLAYFYPSKSKIILPYFPSSKYIQTKINKVRRDEITLCYTGEISKDKGIDNFFNAINALSRKKPLLKINILIIGSTRSQEAQLHFEKLLTAQQGTNIIIQKPVSFEKFTESFLEADICFDLRTINIENNHCLPIKIFYYAGSGKPVIYSDLKATRKIVNVSDFGYLVDPENANLIADYVIGYLDDPGLYEKHAMQARSEYEKKYNWALIRDSFLDIVICSIQEK